MKCKALVTLKNGKQHEIDGLSLVKYEVENLADEIALGHPIVFTDIHGNTMIYSSGEISTVQIDKQGD